MLVVENLKNQPTIIDGSDIYLGRLFGPQEVAPRRVQLGTAEHKDIKLDYQEILRIG